MSGFVKVFGTIRTSSIWVESPPIFKVWMTLLVEADPKGRVFGTVPGIANSAAVSVEECRTAIEKFLSPDPDSRTPDDEGRRIRPIEGGWQLLNYKRYREMRTEKQIATAERVARHRAKGVTGVTSNAGNNRSQKSEVRTTKTTTASSEADALFEAFWKAYPRRAGGNPKGRARKAWNARCNGHDATVAPTIMDGLARYARFVTTTGKVGTEYVMQAATFLGPDQHYLAPWSPPSKPGAAPEVYARCPLCMEKLTRQRWTPHWLSHRTRDDVPDFGAHLIRDNDASN